MSRAEASWRCVCLLLLVQIAGGATCYRQTVPLQHTPPPELFTGMPSLEQLTEAINRTDAIGQLSSNSVSVEVPSMPNVPRLSATLSVDRPRHFRMRAKLPIMLGSGLDMGSNQEAFWFQVPEGMSQTLYFASHESFRWRPNRDILPVDPTWIGDALGLVHIDPQDVVEGPILRTDGRLEVRTMVPLADGLHSRVCIVDPAGGFVTDQMLYGPDGRMLAAASGSQHRYYADQQCSLPHRVQIRLMPAQGPPLDLQLDIGNYLVNQLISADALQFAMPQDASQKIDLSALAMPATGTAAGATTGPATGAPLPHGAGGPPPATVPGESPDKPPREPSGQPSGGLSYR